MMTRRSEEQSLGELFATLARDTSTLVRQEVQLAKVEMTQKATTAGKNAGFVAAGGALAHAGLLALIASAIFALANALPMWLSALVVGLVVIGVGYLLAQKGITALKRIDPAPQQTIATLKEDQEWAKQQMK
jgi:drug/metabolite transporter (DMT)-like permease